MSNSCVLSHGNSKSLFCGSLTLTKLNKVVIRYYRICLRETSYCRKCSIIHLVMHPKIHKGEKRPGSEVWPVFIHQFRYLHYFAFFSYPFLDSLLSNEPWHHAEAFGLLKALRSSPPPLQTHFYERYRKRVFWDWQLCVWPNWNRLRGSRFNCVRLSHTYK